MTELVDDESRVFKELLQNTPPVQENDRYFVIPYAWHVNWQEYLQGRNFLRPAVVPVSQLLDGDKLMREGLFQNVDYALVHSTVWDEIKKRYGTDDEIERRGIENTNSPGDYIIEVYPLKLQLTCDQMKHESVIHISRAAQIQDLRQIVSEKLGKTQDELSIQYLGKDDQKTIAGRPKPEAKIGELPFSDMDIVLVKITTPKSLKETESKNFTTATNGNGEPKVVSPLSQPVSVSLYYGNSGTLSRAQTPATEPSHLSDSSVQTCSIEIQTDEAENAPPAEKQYKATIESVEPAPSKVESKAENPAPKPSPQTAHQSSASSSLKLASNSEEGRFVINKSNTKIEPPRLPKTAGIVGLSNLGNTCFMNSGLQCLSNTVELRNYFLTNIYTSEINYDNVLGTKGALAKEFANLIRNMWSGQNGVVTPRDFKFTLGRHAPQFSGYQQHDSQELLTFLLDGIHEDLNRVKKKPYKEIQETTKPLSEVADELWEYHTSRNSSIIVDIFHGQYKLKITCDTCNTLSYACDPFMFLQVPIPTGLYIYPEIIVLSPSKGNIKYRVKIEKTSTVLELKQELQKLSGIPKESQYIVAVGTYKFAPLTDSSVVQENTRYSSATYCYILSDEIPEEDRMILVMQPHGPKEYYRYPQLGTPTIIEVNKKTLTFQSLCEMTLKAFPQHHKASGYVDGGEFDAKKLPFQLMVVKKSYYTEDYEPITSIEPISKLPSNIMCVWNTKTSTEFKKFSKEEEKATLHESMNQKVNTKSECTLEECLNAFSRPQKLQGENRWFCPKCKVKSDATKKYGIYRFPKVLIIQLKRFTAGPYTREKIDSLVHFPVKGLRIPSGDWGLQGEPPIYDLHAVSNHMGGLGGGHYTAYGLNAETNQWYSFNDSFVSGASESQVVTSSAYVLFYHLRESP